MKKAMILTLLATALILGFGTPAPAQDTIIQTFTGSGIQNTRPFTVQDGWEVQWNTSGDIFQIFVYTAGGDIVGVAANQQGPGEGASYQPKGGRYYLQMNAMGTWTVKVVQLD